MIIRAVNRDQHVEIAVGTNPAGHVAHHGIERSEGGCIGNFPRVNLEFQIAVVRQAYIPRPGIDDGIFRLALGQAHFEAIDLELAASIRGNKRVAGEVFRSCRHKRGVRRVNRKSLLVTLRLHFQAASSVGTREPFLRPVRTEPRPSFGHSEGFEPSTGRCLRGIRGPGAIVDFDPFQM